MRSGARVISSDEFQDGLLAIFPPGKARVRLARDRAWLTVKSQPLRGVLLATTAANLLLSAACSAIGARLPPGPMVWIAGLCLIMAILAVPGSGACIGAPNSPSGRVARHPGPAVRPAYPS